MRGLLLMSGHVTSSYEECIGLNRNGPHTPVCECLAHREWYYQEVWPCRRKCVTGGLALRRFQMLKPAQCHSLSLLPADSDAALPTTSPVLILPSHQHASCRDNNELNL